MGLFKKQGGGFVGRLADLAFEVTEWKDGKKPYHTVTAKMVWEKDGADAPTEQYLPAGFIYPNDGQDVDGAILTGGAGVGENTEFARFVQSAVDKGIPESELLDDDGNGTNFAPLVGYRYEIGFEPNKERQLAAGRKKLGVKAKTASEEEILKAGRRQDKKDKTKFYNHTFLVVTAVLSKDEGEAPKTKGKGKAAVAPKSAAAKGGKANGAAKVKREEASDYDEADALLIDLLGDAKGNTINKASLSSLIVRKALADDMDTATRDGFRKLVGSNEFLERENGWTFAADEKGQPISLA